MPYRLWWPEKQRRASCGSSIRAFSRDSTVALALLPRVTTFVSAISDGGVQKEWDEVYKLMSTTDFEEGGDGGTGKAGDPTSWGSRTRTVSVISPESLMRSLMSNTRRRSPARWILCSPSKTQPIDNLRRWKAGVRY